MVNCTGINATFICNLMHWYCGMVKVLQVCLVPILLAGISLDSYSSCFLKYKVIVRIIIIIITIIVNFFFLTFKINFNCTC